MIVEDEDFRGLSDSTTQVIKKNTGAKKCLILYSHTNSLNQRLETARIEIINPQATFIKMPLWRFASLGALQYLSCVQRSTFLDNEFVEIRRTQTWDGMLIDSSADELTGFLTKHVVLADSFYNMALSVLRNVEGRGFISARDKIDTLIPDFELLSFDSIRLLDERNFGRAQSLSCVGFTEAVAENGDVVLFIHILEKNVILTGEHIFQFSTKTGKIIWWEQREYLPDN